MDQKKLQHFKEILLQKRQSLATMVQRTEGYGARRNPTFRTWPTWRSSPTPRNSCSEEFRDRHILQMIAEALRRIDDRSFGTCAHCEEPILPKRLEAVPWAQHCIQCQGLKDRGLLNQD